ncbi:MAG TPA: hypothetical protein VNL69_01115, partial [Bacteroidota bacterium]|nr:hypothetical protein [Bacteroidota bacterium]
LRDEVREATVSANFVVHQLGYNACHGFHARVLMQENVAASALSFRYGEHTGRVDINQDFKYMQDFSSAHKRIFFETTSIRNPTR